jgi:DNA-binding response OmpR family regulator
MNLNILLAEDQLAFVISEVLNNYNGFHFEFAQTGVEAVRLARSQRFDLMIIDLRLPEMDGIAAIKLIREFDQKTPIIVLTAYGDKCSRARAEEAGATDFFTKPPNYTRLSRRIVELTNVKRADKAAMTPEQLEQWNRRRRLEQLKIHKALCGLDTPPQVIIEIEDLERELGDND